MPSIRPPAFRVPTYFDTAASCLIASDIVLTLAESFAALTALAKQVDGDASGAKDSAKVKMMSDAIKQLAAVSK